MGTANAYRTSDDRVLGDGGSQRTLRQLADSEDEVDKKFRQMVENAAPAIDLSKENPLSYELLFEWQQPGVTEKN